MQSPRVELPNTPRVRTRQGCWSCRRRRRKCDEDKPSCQNCLKKGLTCRYGIQLTFHDANLFELDAHEARDLRARAPESYQNLQFVDGLSEEAEENRSNSEERLSIQNLLQSEIGIGEPVLGDATSVVRLDFTHVPNVQCDYDAVEALQILREDSSRINSIDFSNPHTSRLIERVENPSRTRNIDSSLSFSSPHLSPNDSGSMQLLHVDAAASLNISSRTFCSPGAKDNSQQLLKYYIDSVAPWLEICNDGLYSTRIPLICSKYGLLRRAILALAASQSRRGGADLGSTASPDLGSGNEEAEFTWHLRLTTQLISAPMGQWRSVLSDHVNDVHIHGFSSGKEEVGLLTLRFGLAASIISQSPLTTNFEGWNRTASPHWTTSAGIHDLLHLCAEVLAFLHSTTKDSERWTQLHDLARAQSSGVSLLSSPIGTMSFSGRMTSFPVFIFTDRTSFYSSFVVHTIQLLLFQCKPRRAKLKAATWYAVQICGLSLSNSLLWSWDPLIVAALLFAGSFLSYSKQQLELMEHLKVLREMTGWIFEEEMRELGDAWKLDA